MDAITITLTVVIALLVAAAIFLSVKYFRDFRDDERVVFLAACSNAVRTALAAIADGKITSAEMVQIIKALVEVIAAYTGRSTATVAHQLGADVYMNTVEQGEVIEVTKRT